jgi:hypothetical protein
MSSPAADGRARLWQARGADGRARLWQARPPTVVGVYGKPGRASAYGRASIWSSAARA